MRSFEGQREAAGRHGARRGVGDHLGEQRVELDPDRRARRHARVPAHLGRSRRLEGDEGARRGQEARRRVLGIEACLDGRARPGDVTLRVAERLAVRDAQLLAHQVDAGHRLGDGVLDLEPRVDLEEEELARVVVHQELDRARGVVAERPGEAQRRLAHGLAQRGVDPGRRRLLEDLLVAALDRALALAEMHEVAVGVAQNLDLDVTRARHVALQEDAVVTEAALGFPLGGGHRFFEGVRRQHDAHALAAAPGSSLHQQRVAELIRRAQILRAG